MNIRISTGSRLLLTGLLFLFSARFAFAQDNNSLSTKQTIFTLTFTNRAVPQDSLFLKQMRNVVSQRLAAIYPAQILVKDLVLKEDQLELHLTGKVDTVLVKKLLNKAADLNFYSGVRDARKVISLLKAKGAEKWLAFPPKEVTSFTYLATLGLKDTAAVRKLTRSIVLPGKLKWYFLAKPENIAELYLLDIAKPVVNGNEVIYAERYMELPQASADTTMQMPPSLLLNLNASGKVKLREYTRAHLSEMLAVVTRGEIIMAAIITSEINEGSMVISGGYDVQTINALAGKIGYPFPAAVKVTKCMTSHN